MKFEIAPGIFSVVENAKPAKTVRNKGKNLAKFIDDYCVIDIETTGLDPKWDDIIEISALRVRDSKIVDEFTTLVIPDDFEELPSFISDLTGITTDDILQKGINTGAAVKKFISFVADDVILGHNVNFDINFLYDSLKKYTNQQFNSNFIDTLRIARHALPEERHHRIKDLVEIFSISGYRLHNSLEDCKVTKLIYDELKQILGAKWEYKITYKDNHGKYKFDSKDIIADENKFIQTHIFFDKYFVFTGKLEHLNRKSAAQLVADIGGHPQNGVNKDTNFLVVGSFDYVKSIKDGMSSKQKKAIEKQLSGQDIQILTEDVFLEQLL